MFDFIPRTLVTGSSLKGHIDENVSIHVNVQQEVQRNASQFDAKTTDDLDIRVNLSEPLNAPLKGWVEVIGKPTGQAAINSKEIIIFPEEAGSEPYNKQAYTQMVAFWNNCPDFYKTE